MKELKEYSAFSCLILLEYIYFQNFSSQQVAELIHGPLIYDLPKTWHLLDPFLLSQGWRKMIHMFNPCVNWLKKKNLCELTSTLYKPLILINLKKQGLTIFVFICIISFWYFDILDTDRHDKLIRSPWKLRSLCAVWQ